MNHPVTPDGRYFAVRGRLWRMSDPALGAADRARLVQDLMTARRAMGETRRANDRVGGAAAKAAVDAAKRALGERGPPWWTDGAPDWNRHLAKNTPYAHWWAAVAAGEAPRRDIPPRATTALSARHGC